MLEDSKYQINISSSSGLSRLDLTKQFLKSDDLKQLKNWLASIILRDNLLENKADSQLNLKMAFNQAIDEVFDSELKPHNFHQSNELGISTSRSNLEASSSLMSQVEKRKANLKNRLIADSRRTPLSSLSSPQMSHILSTKGMLSSTNRIEISKSKQLSSHFSDFNQIVGNGSFNQAKRKLLDVDTTSPGPAAYSVDENKIRPNSPRATIPNNSKRYSHIPESVTPGPNYYYPSRHFTAKY